MRSNVCPIIALICISVVKLCCSSSRGCSAAPLLQDKPFVVVWNHPTSLCEDHGIHLDFDRWGIVDNSRDRFFGQEIVLFYSLGKWPYYDNQKRSVNGGIPQLSDLQAHLNKVDNDLKTNVWNATFGGLGVIDMEYWRPLYWTNFDSKSIYQQKSRALAKQLFPHYNQSQILAEAMKEFNKAARDFMSQTLLKTSNKRPNGKWGYYLFPRCYDQYCNTTTITNNDRISWLFQESSGLYPSIYFKLSTPNSSTALKTKQTLHETFRVKAKYSPQDIPIMPYSMSQEGPYKMYQKMDLSLSILQPANMGSSGVVIWGSSSDARAKNECLILKDYINNILGPYSRYVTNFFGNCTEQLCHSSGRCIRKDYERIYQQHLRESSRSECLIPNEMLNDKQTSYFSNDKTITKDIHLTRTDKSSQTESSNTIGKQNKVLRFLDHMKNSLGFNSKWIKAYRGFSERDRSLIKLSKSTNSLQFIKTDDEALTSSKEEINPDLIFDTNSNTNTNPIPSFNADAPDYDFDDYVCKCYPGYTGSHCENKLSN